MLIRYSLFILLILSLTSCFEVVEDITFKKDGSGILKLVINLSQSKNELNSLMKLDSSSGYKIPSEKELNNYLDKALITLKASQGLSKVSIKRDFKNWVFEVKADFINTENLESGLKNIYLNFSGGKPFSFKNKLIFDGKTLERQLQNTDEDTRKLCNRPTEKRIFANAKYITIYRFESAIEKNSNSRAKISPSKKAIMLQSNILNIINGKESIKNLIKLK